MAKQAENFSIRNRITQSGVPVEVRIQSGQTLFFDNHPEAFKQSRQIHSYTYPCFEEVKTIVKGHNHTEIKHVGYCVPK